MPDKAPLNPGWGMLAVLVVVIAASVWLGTLAQRAVAKSSFLKGFFLGNRGLGVWAMALTATVQSGGTFMGFPSFVYKHGWIAAVWIGSYMLVPLTGFGILGKRMAQLSRRTGAVTVPDLFRRRFDSPSLGLTTSLFILVFLTFLLFAQFKAGAIVMKIAFPGTGALAIAEEQSAHDFDTPYLIGLAIFAATVVLYTLIGGFLASVWTDLFQSVLMWIGVMILLVLAMSQVGGLEQATVRAVERTGPGFAFGPGYSRNRDFLPVGLAISMFVLWTFGGVSTPASVVRLMASKDSRTLRRSVLVLSLYNCCIYLPLIAVCIAARSLMPDLKVTDEVIPRMALHTTRDLPGGTLISGLILAAPFGAIMATVSTFLVVISSGLVHDVYQQFFDPHADERRLKRLTRVVMIVLGIAGVAANIRPVQHLQALIVFCTSGAASTFLAPTLMAAYWRRANAAGAIAAMLAGGGITLVLFVAGLFSPDPMIGHETKFRTYYLLGFDPAVWGIPGSLLAGVIVSSLTAAPNPTLVSRMFDRVMVGSGPGK